MANRNNSVSLRDFDDPRTSSRSHNDKSARKKTRQNQGGSNSHKDDQRGHIYRNGRKLSRDRTSNAEQRLQNSCALSRKLSQLQGNDANFMANAKELLRDYPGAANLVVFSTIASHFFRKSEDILTREEKRNSLDKNQKNFLVDILSAASSFLQFNDTNNVQALTSTIHALSYVNYDELNSAQIKKVDRFLEHAQKHIERIPEFDAPGFVIAFSAFPMLPTKKVTPILNTLLQKLDKSNVELDTKQFRTILEAVFPHAEADTLQKVFDIALEKLNDSEGWTGESLGRVLTSLSKLKVKPNVIKFLAEIKDNVLNHDEQLKFQDLSNILFNSALINSYLIEMMLPKLTKDIKEAKESILAPLDLAHILYGVTGNDSTDAVTQFLEAVTEQLPKCKSSFESIDLAMSFTGLRNPGLKVPDELWKFLGEHFEKNKQNPDFDNLSSILIATREHKNLLARAIFKSALKQLEEILPNYEITKDTEAFTFSLIRTMRDPEFKKYDLAFSAIEKYGEITRGMESELRFLGYLRPELKSRIDELIDKVNIVPDENPLPRSHLERIAEPIIKKHFTNIITNHFIDGIELDFYDKETKINIEIDGLHHCGFERLKDQLRDDYLRDVHGITVSRVKFAHEDLFCSKSNYSSLIEEKITAQILDFAQAK